MAAIYTYDQCGFTFERVGEPESCPDCGSNKLRTAQVNEVAEYKQQKNEFGRNKRKTPF